MGPFRSCWNGTTSALQPEEITSKRTRVSINQFLESIVYVSMYFITRKNYFYE